MSSTVADTQNKSKDERTPLTRERLRRFLVVAGADGLTAHQLAQLLYKENSNVTRNRVRCLICSLRWNGVEIAAVKDSAFLLRRYVLAEFVIVAESAKP